MGLDDEFVRSERLLSLKAPGDVVAWAATEVARGRGETVLVRLASLWSDDLSQVDALLDQLLSQQGIGVPTAKRALSLVLSAIASDVLSGRMTPATGAHRVFHLASTVGLEVDPEFVGFTALASEWDDDEEHRGELEADMLSEFREVAERPR